MRCFLAVDLADILKEKIAVIQERLGKISDAKIVEQRNLHFTLKFLGELDDEQITNVKNSITSVAENFKPFEITVKGMGVFPSPGYIRVVWIGAVELASLQKAVDDALYPAFAREKEIAPHLTLARIRSPKNKNLLAEFVEKNRDLEIGKMTVNIIKLKKSILRPSGPRYDDYFTWDL